MTNPILSSISVRDLQTITELESVRNLEALIWSHKESTPITQVVATVKNGGFVLGAFLKEELIGFQYSFPGFDGRKIYLYSHTLGIHPKYRKCGIGEKLKRAQKKVAIEKGYDLIKWTYDPLETVNGNLNLHKLGAICTTYLENVYGEIPDQLNSGISSDRFLVEWSTKQSIMQSKNPLKTNDYPLTIQTINQNGYQIPVSVDLKQDQNELWVPVPSNYQELKKEDFAIALKWREVTRQVFTYYLSLGWIVNDIVRDFENQNQYFYHLEKQHTRR
ncbi:GNAT family N-acetyltransferase [Alkalihalobacillus sp. BA299]|uniref:GNAT family N-acetyltransferase n=1 Tax=Alkalihalobacillus sp. BA299 TaxID=2815938 RepID=UPI001ADB5516|nr:GNAT family N-acetyltransferase [Alkalihalobacillus sp. BA299]